MFCTFHHLKFVIFCDFLPCIVHFSCNSFFTGQNKGNFCRFYKKCTKMHVRKKLISENEGKNRNMTNLLLWVGIKFFFGLSGKSEDLFTVHKPMHENSTLRNTKKKFRIIMRCAGEKFMHSSEAYPHDRRKQRLFAETAAFQRSVRKEFAYQQCSMIALTAVFVSVEGNSS